MIYKFLDPAVHKEDPTRGAKYGAAEMAVNASYAPQVNGLSLKGGSLRNPFLQRRRYNETQADV